MRCIKALLALQLVAVPVLGQVVTSVPGSGNGTAQTITATGAATASTSGNTTTINVPVPTAQSVGAVPFVSGAYFVFDGDSRVCGTPNTCQPIPYVIPASPTGNDFPSQAMKLPAFAGHGTGINLGIGGQTCEQISARYPNDAHLYSPAVTGKPGYFILNCGTNDEAETASQIETAIAGIWSQAVTDGYTVIATTNPNHATTSATRNLNDTYNTWIRSQKGVGYNYLADLQNVLHDVYDSSTFFTDRTHFTNLGYLLIAQTVADALQNLGSAFFSMPLAGRYIVPGTGNSSTRLEETCLYSLTTGTSDGCGGYGSIPLATTASYVWAWGDNTLASLIDGSNILAMGHGAGANIVHQGNGLFLLCSPTGDFAGASCAGANSSVGSSYSTAYGYASTTSAQCTSVGVGAGCTAAGAVEVATTTNSNSLPNSFKFNGTILGRLSGTLASLPACAAALDGSSAGVTDSTLAMISANIGSTITGGGTNHVRAYCNGTNWVVD